MNRLALALLIISLTACTTARNVAALTGAAPTNPLDVVTRARAYLAEHPEKKAFVLADLNNAYDMAKASGEIDGMTCMPTLIGCINDDAAACGEPLKVSGLFSAREARILGTPIRQFFISKKLHHDCAAWFTDRNIVGGAMAQLFGGL